MRAGFWLKTEVYWEQPSVSYRQELIAIVQGATPESLIAWSTFPGFNTLIGNQLRTPVVEVRMKQCHPVEKKNVFTSTRVLKWTKTTTVATTCCSLQSLSPWKQQARPFPPNCFSFSTILSKYSNLTLIDTLLNSCFWFAYDVGTCAIHHARAYICTTLGWN